jgi:CheY-like chemotaxis protein
MPKACLKILIVDDHQPIRELIKAIVRDLSSELLEAGNGEEGLRVYRERRPDFVVMDLCMPGMGGLEAMRLLMIEFPEAQVIVATQHGEALLREAALKTGACGYVLKENLLQIRGLIESTAKEMLA